MTLLLLLEALWLPPPAATAAAAAVADKSLESEEVDPPNVALLPELDSEFVLFDSKLGVDALGAPLPVPLLPLLPVVCARPLTHPAAWSSHQNAYAYKITASTCSNSASMGIICLLTGWPAAFEPDDAAVEGDEYSLIRLSPECFNARPFSRHTAAIRLKRSLVHLECELFPFKAILSGDGALRGCWGCCWLRERSVGAGDGSVGEIEACLWFVDILRSAACPCLDVEPFAFDGLTFRTIADEDESYSSPFVLALFLAFKSDKETVDPDLLCVEVVVAAALFGADLVSTSGLGLLDKDEEAFFEEVTVVLLFLMSSGELDLRAVRLRLLYL